MAGRVAVRPLAERHHLVALEGVENRGDRVDTLGRTTRRLSEQRGGVWGAPAVAKNAFITARLP